MFTKYGVKFLILGGLVLALSGCFQDTEEGQTTGTSTEPIVIGALLPLSGEGATYGLPAQRVLNIAMNDINNSGGVNGRQIKLEFEDGGCGADMANKAINSLVSIKKVKVVIGGFCSSETLTAAPVVEQNRVLLLSPASSSPKITTAGDFVFRNYPSDNAQGEALADYANSRGYKKVGMIVEEQPYTEGIADTFQTAFQRLNGTGTVVIEKYTPDASDFRTQITKLQAANVDVFFVDTQTPVKAGLIVKQLQEAGVSGPFILNDVAFGATKEVVEAFKDYVEGSVGAEVPYNRGNPAITTLQAAYKLLAGGEELPYMTYMASTYDSLFIIKEAIASVGDDPVKIKDYLYTVKNRVGLAGVLSFDSNGDPGPEYRHALRIIRNGVAEDYTATSGTTTQPAAGTTTQ